MVERRPAPIARDDSAGGRPLAGVAAIPEVWAAARRLHHDGAEVLIVRSDIRYAWRALWKSPTTTVGAMLALALGIGATTTIFGLRNAVLLRPLPYPEAERLVEIFGTVQREQVDRRGNSFPDYFDWRDQSQSYDGMSAWIGSGFILYGAGRDRRRPVFRSAGRARDCRPCAGRSRARAPSRTLR